MYKIYSKIWQGGLVKHLDKEIEAVVSLLTDEERDLQKYPNGLKAIVNFPIEDGRFPGLKWLKMVVATVEALKENHCVYIHCRGGVSRSAMVTIAVLMKENNWRVKEALDFLGSKNSDINPNMRFQMGLKEWEAELGL